MATQPENNKSGKQGKVALVICFLLFGIYFINVLVGKANILFSLKLPHLGNVMEFLLLAMASVSFIVAALRHETAEN